MSFQSRKPSDDCLSDLLLDTLIAGDSSSAEQQRARAHADTCGPCRARWQVLARQAESAVLPALPALTRQPARAAASVAPSRRRGFARLRWAGAAVAACCAILLFQRFTPEGDTAGERLKGGVRLGLFVQRGGELLRGGPGELLHPGETLQLTFFAPSAGYLVVLGRDATGKVSVYYPSGVRAAPVAAGEQALPESSLLDDTLGEETIEAVFCTSERDVESLRAASERALALDGCQLDAVRVVKEAR